MSGSFFFDCSGISLYDLISEVSKRFSVTIFVFEDIRDKKVYARMISNDLKKILDSICWYCSVEYFERDGVYYIGSNSKTVIVLPSAGVDLKIENVFQDVTVKHINDKLVLYGEERAVSRVQGIYKDLVQKHFIQVRFYAFEVLYDKNILFGFDIEKSVEYAFSWENLISNSYNPVQSLAISLYASLEAESDQLRVKSLIDTNLGVLSGDVFRLQIGEDKDRPVYSQSGEGDRVISSYDTFSTGLILDVKGSYTSEAWIFDVQIENSDSLSDLSKTLTKLTTKGRLSKTDPVALLAQLTMQQTKESYSKGIPFISDLPFIGSLFRVSSDRTMERRLFFVITLEPDPKIPSHPGSISSGSFLVQLCDKISSMCSFLK